MSERFAREDVERLARLARLRLSEDELTQFAGQLTRILAYADAVREVNTDDVPPTSHPLSETGAPVREDRTSASLATDEALAGAPDADASAGLFKVPRVI